MFRLAHVTDPHFRGKAGVRIAELASKRAIGYANLILNRRRKHKGELLEAMLSDLRAQAVDHLALTGDLSNLSLAGEWHAALQWLSSYGAPPDAVTVIPGNHDAYVADVVRDGTFERLFADYQRGERKADGPGGSGAALGSSVDGSRAGYPFLRLRGPLAIVSVNSCVPTGDLGAWGEIGELQLRRLEEMLTGADVAHHVRVVLIHHPPVMLKGNEARNLRDRAGFCAVLARAGADLVLHGHDHQDESAVLEGPAGRSIPVIGAGSASYTGGPEKRSRYNIYEIAGDTITVLTRVHDEATGAFTETRRDRLG